MNREWIIAFIAAGIIHGCIAAVLFWAPLEAKPGQAKDLGAGGIEISLGPAGQKASEVSSSKEVSQPTDKEPELEPKQEKQVVEKPVVQERKIEKRVVEKQVVEQKKPAKKILEQEIVQTVTSQVAEQSIEKIKNNAVRHGEKKSDTLESLSDKQGSGNNTAGGGQKGELESYAMTLLAWLERHKEYPRRARARRHQGTALLYFVVDRQGQVLSYRIRESSGSRLLDQEVIDMLNRAQPLPSIPGKLSEETLELVVPVEFSLRT